METESPSEISPHVCSATAWEVDQVADQVARQGGKVYVEIGSFQGGSLWAFGGVMPAGSLLIAVDRPLARAGDELARVAAAMRTRGYSVDLVAGDSHDELTLGIVRDALFSWERLSMADTSVDVLLIDGDHSPAGCRRDLAMYAPLVRPGGLVILHDCGGPCPAKALAPCAAAVLSGLHPIWREWSNHRRSLLIQEWAGYGMFWM